MNADTLSRIPSREIGDTISVTAIEELLSRDTLQSLNRAQVEDPRLGKVVEALKNGTIFPSGVAPGLKRTFLHDGLLCRQFRASSSDCVHTQLLFRQVLLRKSCISCTMNQDILASRGLKKRSRSVSTGQDTRWT